MNTTLPAMTPQRCLPFIERQEVKYTPNKETDGWNFFYTNLRVWIDVTATALTVSGMWRGQSLSDEEARSFLEFAYAHNTNQILPSCALQGDGSAEAPYHLVMSHSFPIRLGLSDEQLDDVLHYSVGLMAELANLADETFPHLVTWSDEEDN